MNHIPAKAHGAKAIAIRQRHYTRLHHQMRLAWVGGHAPVWADGVPLSPGDVKQIQRSSIAQLRQPTGCHVDLDDTAYLAELDAFDRRSAYEPGSSAALSTASC